MTPAKLTDEVTAETVTDDQIRELQHELGADLRNALWKSCQVALHGASTNDLRRKETAKIARSRIADAIEARKLTDDKLSMLAKVRCAEHISQRIKSPIPRTVADLAYGPHSGSATLLKLKAAGLVGWDNGSILTSRGAALLTAAINARKAER